MIEIYMDKPQRQEPEPKKRSGGKKRDIYRFLNFIPPKHTRVLQTFITKFN